MRITTFLGILTFCLFSSPALSQSVPQEALNDFESSFIIDQDGVIIGARVSELQPYLSEQEIINLFNQATTESQNDASMIGGDLNIFLGYKPKGLNGCKRNRRWICRLRGEVQN